jgi:hypothetical protein
MLKVGVVEVEFLKKDGSNRVMRCTLSGEIIPEQEYIVVEGESSSVKHQKSADLMSVYDIDSGGWRSFSLARLLDVREAKAECGECEGCTGNCL